MLCVSFFCPAGCDSSKQIWSRFEHFLFCCTFLHFHVLPYALSLYLGGLCEQNSVWNVVKSGSWLLGWGVCPSVLSARMIITQPHTLCPESSISISVSLQLASHKPLSTSAQVVWDIFDPLRKISVVELWLQLDLMFLAWLPSGTRLVACYGAVYSAVDGRQNCQQAGRRFWRQYQKQLIKVICDSVSQCATTGPSDRLKILFINNESHLCFPYIIDVCVYIINSLF